MLQENKIETSPQKHLLVMPKSISRARIAELIQAGIDADIAEIDLAMVKLKMLQPDEGENWDRAQCEDGEKEYKRYLTLAKKYPHPNYSIVPNKIMDIVWHYHILDTRAYIKDTNRIFGGYFHHYPYFGLRGDEDKKALENCFIETCRFYEKQFGEKIDANGQNCWHDCEGRCWNACSD